MATFVVNGEDAPLKATLAGKKAETIDQVTFTIYRRDSGGETVIDTIPAIPVKKLVAAKDWTSKGLGDDEMQCTAYLRATAGTVKASGTDPIIIYRDSLTIVAKDESGKPAKNALCQASIEVDPLFFESQSGTLTSRVGRTDESGTVVFSGLPPGEVTLTWRTPWAFKEWVKGKDKGASREVTLKRVIRARVLSHPSGKSPYRQYVNQAADPLHPELGRVVKVKVGIDPVSGPAQSGDKVFMKVSFWAQNSDLNDPLPKFEGTSGGKGKMLAAVSKDLELDGTAVFELDLGVPGGDHATVSVGGTNDCGDDNVTFENWRRIPTKLYYPPQFPLTGGRLPAGIEDQVKSSLAAVFIELDYIGATPAGIDCTLVAQDIALKMGLTDAFCFYKLGASPEKGLVGKFNTPETQLNILVGQFCFGWDTTPVTVELKSARSEKLSAPSGFLMPWCPDDTPFIGRVSEGFPARGKDRGLPVVEAKWEWDGGAEGGPIDPTWFKLDGGRDYHIELPRAQRTDPGSLASKKKPVKLRFGLKVFNSIGGSSTGNWFLTTWKTPQSVEDATHTLLHELGHSLGQAASSNADTPGLPASHPNHYTGHGHQGDHCAFGLPARYVNEEDYAKLIFKKPPVHGNCIMWGGVGKGFRYAEASTFCADCTAYLRARKIEKVGP
jgi:hypothetical protein